LFIFLNSFVFITISVAVILPTPGTDSIIEKSSVSFSSVSITFLISSSAFLLCPEGFYTLSATPFI
jgi:hypothetical protein